MTNNNGGYGQYPSSEHPEDQPNFGQQQADSPYPGSVPTGGGTYGDYGAQQPQANINSLYNAPMVVRESGLNIGQCLSYGFKATFARPLVWIVGALIFFAISFVGSMFNAVTAEFNGGEPSLLGQMINIFMSLFSFVVMPHIYYALIKQVDGEKLSLNQVAAGVKWGPGIATSILTSIISLTPIVILGGIFVLPMIRKLTKSTYMTEGEAWSLVFGIFGALILIVIASMFFSILFQPATYYAVEGREGVIEAIKASFRDVARNYLPFLGLCFIVTIMLLAGVMVTFGLAIIILWPAAAHAMVYAYRQISKAPYPNI